jgi:hypothetical protein
MADVDKEKEARALLSVRIYGSPSLFHEINSLGLDFGSMNFEARDVSLFLI